MSEKCPTCGREFGSKKGLGLHRTQTHNYPSKIKVECSNCGNKKKLTRYKAERSENHFCNKDCYGEWISGENHPKWNREEVSCANCGKVKEVSQKEIRDHENFFCDYECSAEWQSEHRMGEKHPAWKGEEGVRAMDYGGEWSKIRKRFVSKTKDECCMCGINEEKNGRELSVHHIIRPKEFDCINNAHQEKNMMRLCHRCHPKVESMDTKEQFNYHPTSNGEWMDEQ